MCGTERFASTNELNIDCHNRLHQTRNLDSGKCTPSLRRNGQRLVIKTWNQSNCNCSWRGAPPLLYGILFPSAEITLDEIEDDQITPQHLISLLNAVICLHVADVWHGNICERNVCVRDSSIQLINFDYIALDYEGDIDATGQLFLRCVPRMTLSNDQAAKICEAAWELVEGDDVNWALWILEQSGVTSNSTDVQFDLSTNMRRIELDSD